MSLLLFESICIFLLSQVLLVLGVQEIHADRKMISKISAAGQLMQCSASLDVLFLLDSSYSIGKGSFERSKHFVGKLCDALDICPDRVHVGVIQFSSIPHLEFPLDLYLTKQEVKESIKRIMFRGGSTETGWALKYILHKGFPGGRNSSVPKVLIIISDGKSQGSTVMPAKQVKERHITVFAVGIKLPRWKELHVLGSEPMEQHMLFAGDANDAANGLYSTLTGSVCSATAPGCKVESHPCERRTLETVKELAGNYVCWKGSKQPDAVQALLCPFDREAPFALLGFPGGLGKDFSMERLQSLAENRPPPPPPPPSHSAVEESLNKTPIQMLPNAPKLSLQCGVALLFLMDSSAGVTLEGFLRYKAFLKRFLQAVMGQDSPMNVGVAQYDNDVRIPIEVGQHKDAFGLIKSIDALNFSGGGTLTGKALQYIAQHGFRSTPVSADIQDDLPHVVVLLTDSKSQDPVAEAAKNVRDQDLFLIGVGSSLMRAELTKVTGNPKQAILDSDPQDLFSRIPELQRRICSVDNPEEAKSPMNLCKPNPCMNQGVCILGPGSYRCECHGWEGPHCESRVLRGNSPRSPSLPLHSHV
ncbi:von Willebrand factor A domain-containing protein 2 [Falco naumanni]|uniref:von Willebrand factor A domain-containing protein 2 n=1 Tax=Falco naumanni TaxID=148594 RepID=UPI001ADEB4BC|nr:von Willebrand factor A domain-containing protein 2 [Falco naumanni]